MTPRSLPTLAASSLQAKSKPPTVLSYCQDGTFACGCVLLSGHHPACPCTLAPSRPSLASPARSVSACGTHAEFFDPKRGEPSICTELQSAAPGARNDGCPVHRRGTIPRPPCCWRWAPSRPPRRRGSGSARTAAGSPAWRSTPSGSSDRLCRQRDRSLEDARRRRHLVAQRLGAPGCTLRLAIDPTATATVYAGGTGGVARARTAGQPGCSRNPPARPATGRSTIVDIAIDPQNPGTLYAASGGVFKSLDGGTSWTRSSTGLPQVPVTSLTIDSC